MGEGIAVDTIIIYLKKCQQKIESRRDKGVIDEAN